MATSIWSISGNWGWTNENNSTQYAQGTFTLSSGKVLTTKDKITKVTYTVAVRVSAGDGADYWKFQSVNIGSSTGTPSMENGNTISYESYSQTLSTELSFTDIDAKQFLTQTITVYDRIYSDAGESKNTRHNVEHYNASVTIEYEENGLQTSHTISYHNGTEWVQCEVYYHDGENWVLCDPYYHDGTDWVLVDTQ